MAPGGMLAKTPIDEKLAEILAPSAEGLGYALVRIRLMGGKRATLQVMAERIADGGMDVEDCATLSRTLSAVLDVEDPIADEYVLEVSSPGIDRPLTRPQDFDRWAGHEAKLELRDARDGRRRFRGRLAGLAGAAVRIETDADGAVELPFEELSDAKLVLTDALIAESLKASKSGAAADGAEIDMADADGLDLDLDLDADAEDADAEDAVADGDDDTADDDAPGEGARKQ